MDSANVYAAEDPDEVMQHTAQILLLLLQLQFPYRLTKRPKGACWIRATAEMHVDPRVVWNNVPRSQMELVELADRALSIFHLCRPAVGVWRCHVAGHFKASMQEGGDVLVL